jgi:glyoxylase-like metal-dependent hydrolase (beta-lactamase superfamily II)
MTDARTPGSDAPLKWDLFVTSGIPTVTPDPPPGERRRFFSPISSTLIYGERDAVLVDTFMTIDQNDVLADWIKGSGKNLIAIYVTHGHGDHWFGIGALLERFPGARAIASPGVVKMMKEQPPEALKSVWQKRLPGQIPERLVIAEELAGNVIKLEGQDLVVVEVGHTDTHDTTLLHVPAIGLVVAGEAAYNGVHQLLAETNPQKRREWVAAFDTIGVAEAEHRHCGTQATRERKQPANPRGGALCMDWGLLKTLRRDSQCPCRWPFLFR